MINNIFKLFCLSVIAIAISAGNLFAQLTLSNGDHTVEISGIISSYYNYRFNKPGDKDFDRNRFDLRDAGLQLEGRYKKIAGYEFQIDFADLIQNQGGIRDFENPGLMDAFMYLRITPNIRIKGGYSKLPYSFTSITPFVRSPFWQRAEIARGDIFSRRDIGASVQATALQEKIVGEFGVYNGLGESSLRGINDKSGVPEFVGRMQFSYPVRYRYNLIDTRHSPIPMFAIGVNGRYTRRFLLPGENFPTGTTGEFGVKVIDGTRYVYGGDFNFMFRGFSLQAEIHQVKNMPQDSSNFLLAGTPSSFNKGFSRSGGYLVQANYFSKQLKSIFSVRYDELNINDLLPGQSERISFAYAYQLRSYDSMIRIQFTRILNAEPIAGIKYASLIRVGWQVMLN
jgi:hypothetical protein